MQVVVGMLLLVTGLAGVTSALPLAHRLVRVMPQWTFTRGDVERLASTAFLTVFVGLLGGVAAVVLLPEGVVQH